MTSTAGLSTIEAQEILTVPEGVWESFRGARIFLTGGTGFFGQALLESFLIANVQKKLGATLVVLSRDPQAFLARSPQFEQQAIEFHTGDVRHFATPEAHFTHVLHAATESSGGQRHHSDLHMADTILEGTRHVLELARAHKARMLYVSSGAVYGRQRAEMVPISENDSRGPQLTEAGIAYDESKRMAEALCMLYHRAYHFPVTIARGFSFVGPGLPLHEHFAIGNFIGDAINGKTISINSDGSAVRSYLYTTDLARWLWTMLAIAKPASIYNLGSDEEVSIAALAQRVQQVVNPKGKVEIKGKAVPGAIVSYQVPNITRAESELGLKPLVALDEAIRRTAAWHKANPRAASSAAPSSTVDSILAKPAAIVFDFDGVMTDNRVAVLQDGREAVFCDRSDGLGIGMLKQLGIPMLVLSTEANPVVAARCAKLKLECIQGQAVKETALAQWLKDKNYDPARTIYLGNDINDLGCLKSVGLPAVVGDAYPEAKAVARLVLTKLGGKGAVRELADRVIQAHQAASAASASALRSA